MKLNRRHIINSLSIFFLGFLFLSDAMSFVGFHHGQKSDCCGSECHCKVDNQCDMTIDCGTTRVVLLIPLVNIDVKGFDIVEPMEFFTTNIDLKFLENKTHVIDSQNNPILKPPLTSINTPLLI